MIEASAGGPDRHFSVTRPKASKLIYGTQLTGNCRRPCVQCTKTVQQPILARTGTEYRHEKVWFNPSPDGGRRRAACGILAGAELPRLARSRRRRAIDPRVQPQRKRRLRPGTARTNSEPRRRDAAGARPYSSHDMGVLRDRLRDAWCAVTCATDVEHSQLQAACPRL
jgi:hypothetical protein